MPEVSDDLGNPVRLPGRVRAVVSLVPSLTESLAATDPGLVVAATRYCTHPPDLAVARVGGTKNPDIERIIGLAPDLVVANEEENRPEDLAALCAAGLAVWVTWVRGLDQALRSLDRMITVACGLARPDWLDVAARAWDVTAAEPGHGGDVSAFIPIWRRPWMVIGRETFAGDLLARLGIANVYGSHQERYPKIGIAELRASGADLVVLPDEPYRFTATDGPEAFGGLPSALVSGRLLTWYGPSLADAHGELRRQLSPGSWLDPPDQPAGYVPCQLRNRSGTLAGMDAVLQALSDQSRRTLLETLSGGPATAGELAEMLPIARPGVSRHLRVLREAGLVDVRQDAQRRIYSLRPEPLAEVDAWLGRYRALWEQRLDALHAEIARGKTERRSTR